MRWQLTISTKKMYPLFLARCLCLLRHGKHNRRSLSATYHMDISGKATTSHLAFIDPRVAQRDAPFKENGSRSFIVAGVGSATPAELFPRHHQASDVTRNTCEAALHSTACLLSVRCATRGPDEWLQRGRIDPRTVTAYYAGMLAMAYYCASYGGEDDYQEGSERDDLEKIKSLLLRLSSGEQERSAIQDACWMEAQKILSDYWSAVQALATKFLKHRTLAGRDAHLIIWRTTGYPDADWRFGALNIPRVAQRAALFNEGPPDHASLHSSHLWESSTFPSLPPDQRCEQPRC